MIPPLFKVILYILDSIKCELENKNVCVLYNSEIFGKSLSKVLECRKAKVELVHLDDKGLENKTKKADILISAIGKPNFVKKDFIKKDSIIVDIGTTREGGRIFGDVDFEDVKEKASFITPVPGGVGPLTIAMLFKNTLELYKNRKK